MDILWMIIIVFVCIPAFPYIIAIIIDIAVCLFVIFSIVSAWMVGAAIVITYAVTHPKELFRRRRS